MKNLIIAITTVLLSSANTFSQTGELNKDTSTFTTAPLYVVKLASGKTSTTSTSLLAMIDQHHIDAMEIYTDRKNVEQYGDKAKNGVVIITLKKDALIITQTEIFDKYKISKANRKLPVYLDSNLTHNSADNFYSANKIKSVKIAKEKGTGMKYISIITDFVRIPPDPNTFRIRGNVIGAVK
ncbi:MAG: hypothetical protein V4581_12860 [Bacteroidota bacterium]